MKIFDKLVLIIYSIVVAVASFFVLILPFDLTNFLGIDTILRFITNIKGNYLFALIGFIILSLSLIHLISLLKTKSNKEPGSYLVLRNEHGEILIYEDTIVGLVDYVAGRFSGISNIKTKVKFFEGQVQLFLKGEASYEINIPQTSKDLQLKVKEHIENTTGSKVGQIKVEIINVTTPVNRIK